jgi:hypothetical protein
MFFEANKELRDLLKGKRVALVGPSPHLLGKECGSKIDESDLVCRINNIVDEEHAIDYGRKNDIIFHSCPTLWIHNFASKLERDKEVTRNIKFVVCPSLKAIHDGSGSVIENFKKINKYDIPFWWIGPKNYWILRNRVGVEPNSGTMAIMILLSCSVKELLITGFSFYAQYSDNQSYNACYYNGGDYNPGNDNGVRSPLVGHQQGPQIHYIANHIIPQYGEKIIIDSVLNKILSANHHKVMEID